MYSLSFQKRSQFRQIPIPESNSQPTPAEVRHAAAVLPQLPTITELTGLTLHYGIRG
jgi:hypothetical protein